MSSAPKALFSSKPVTEFFRERREAMGREIDRIDPSALLSRSAEELAHAAADKYAVATLSITPEKMEFDSGESATRGKAALWFYIPFTGSADLFHYAPTESVHGIAAGDPFRVPNTLVITFEAAEPDLNPDAVRGSLDRYLEVIEANLARLADDVRDFNNPLLGLARSRIDARVNALRDNDWEKKLGVPRRKRE